MMVATPCRRWIGAALAVLAVGGLPAPAPAQNGAVGKSSRVEPLLLLVRPRVGDTLRLFMEQSIEIGGRRAIAASSGPSGMDRRRELPPARDPDYGPRQARATTRITKLQLFAHSLVESSDLTVTTLLATTDSMTMWAGSALERGEPVSMPLPLDGRQVRVRVSPDGTMRVSEPPPGAMQLGSTLAAMPGLLPEEAVRVGDRWERDMVLPSLPVSGYRADGVVHTRLRFDSLTSGGRIAWISMSGELRRDGAAREMPPGTRLITAGTIEGLLVVDRTRAWIVDARTTLDVLSEVAPGPGGPLAPMLLEMRILQRVRVR